jgi:hypothetical protein
MQKDIAIGNMTSKIVIVSVRGADDANSLGSHPLSMVTQLEPHHRYQVLSLKNGKLISSTFT